MKNKEEKAKVLIERNELLLNALIRRIERDCPDAVDMIGIYGSFCTGDFNERSDLDLMILINDPKAWAIAKCFVIGDIGYDFYCTTWESLEEDAKCGSACIAKLMDSRIVYCKKPAAMERYMALREKVRGILSTPFSRVDLERAEAEYGNAEKEYAKLMRSADDDVFECRLRSVAMLYYLENAVCILNKTWFKLGVKRMFDEFAAMERVPANFEALARKVSIAETTAEIKDASTALMRAADETFESARRDAAGAKEKPAAENIGGTLEEMISNYRGKMWKAAETGDAHAALSALGGLQNFFDSLHAGLDMPRYDALSGFDGKDLEKTAAFYEAAIEAYKTEYDKIGLPVNRFDTVEEFCGTYLKK